MARRYYHGTSSIAAAAALSKGDGLAPMAPEGRRRLSGGLAGRSYLASSVKVACRYAKMIPGLRKDRAAAAPEDWNGSAWVFAFDLDRSTPGFLPEEDDLGRAVRLVLEMDAGWHDGFDHRLGIAHARHPNPALGPMLPLDVRLVSELRSQAISLLPASVLNLVDPSRGVPTIGQIARVGRLMADRMKPALAEALIDAGMDVSIPFPATADAGWLWLTPSDIHGKPYPADETALAGASAAIEIVPVTPPTPW